MSVLKLIKRYTTKAIGIIVDRHAPPPTGDLTMDAEGEWMKYNDLLILIQQGALLEVSTQLMDELEDGRSQRAFMRDVTALGYEDFDQVMQVLREQRTTVLKERTFEIWTKGYQATGEYAPPALVGTAIALSFEEACRKFYNDTRASGSHKLNDWKFDPKTNRWSDYCGHLVDAKPDK